MDEKKRILIVEDDAAISDIVVYNLMKEGFEALAAYDGETGLSMALNDAPDLILLDLMLPGINGFEICRPPLMSMSKSTIFPAAKASSAGAAGVP